MNSNTMIWILASIILSGVLVFMVGASNMVKSNQVINSVVVTQDMVDILRSGFEKSSHEFVMCLYGEIVDDKAFIKSWNTPKVLSVSDKSVLYESCSNGIISKQIFLGAIHNHPSGICRLSDTDIFSYGRSGAPMTGILCNDDEPLFFVSQTFEKPLAIEVLQ